MKLIIHAGWGKTGSSAIQKFLSSRNNDLEEEGILYSGLFFENCPFYEKEVKGFENMAAPVRFAAMVADSNYNLKAYLLEQIELLKRHCTDKGYHTVIWSNEGIALAVEQLAPLFSEICRTIDIEFVVYLRRQDDWFLSAYKQWGIKHKTYKGKPLNFVEWLKLYEKQADYNDVLSSWEKIISIDSIHVRVFDKCSDVVSDFCSLARLPIETSNDNRFYDSVSAEELALHKLYNVFFDEPHLPFDLELFIKRSHLQPNLADSATLDLGFPTKEELHSVYSKYIDQNIELTRFSKSGYSVEFHDDETKDINQPQVSYESILGCLLFTSIRSEQRIRQLEVMLEKLNREINK